MRKFILTTILGGVVFLIPFVLVVVLLGKGFRIMRVIAERVDIFLPWDSIVGLPIINLITIFFLISFCFIAGLAAKSGLGKNIQNKIDDILLNLIPGYAWLKGLTGSVSGEEVAAILKPVWVRFDDQCQVGFEVERCEGGLVAVFLPGAPDPRAGTLIYVDSGRVDKLATNFKDIVTNFRRLGLGSAAKISNSKMSTQSSI